jgi:hypothetical protein
MSYAEEQAILDSFSEKAQLGQLTNVQEIKAAFDAKLGRDTGRGYIYMLLKRHGWRRVKPRPKHPKAASAEACDASKVSVKPTHVFLLSDDYARINPSTGNGLRALESSKEHSRVSAIPATGGLYVVNNRTQ